MASKYLLSKQPKNLAFLCSKRKFKNVNTSDKKLCTCVLKKKIINHLLQSLQQVIDYNILF